MQFLLWKFLFQDLKNCFTHAGWTNCYFCKVWYCFRGKLSYCLLHMCRNVKNAAFFANFKPVWCWIIKFRALSSNYVRIKAVVPNSFMQWSLLLHFGETVPTFSPCGISSSFPDSENRDSLIFIFNLPRRNGPVFCLHCQSVYFCKSHFHCYEKSRAIRSKAA